MYRNRKGKSSFALEDKWNNEQEKMQFLKPDEKFKR